MPATYDALPIDETFPRNYEVEWLVDLPNSPSLKCFFLNPSAHADGSGPILQVSGADGRFVAVVGGSLSNLRLCTMPSPWCFLALPSAVVVNAKEPERSGILEGFSEWRTVHYIVPLVERGLMLVGHDSAMYCYNAEGLLWRMEKAFCCVDPVIEIAGEDLVLTAINHLVDLSEIPKRKTFDLLTGKPR